MKYTLKIERPAEPLTGVAKMAAMDWKADCPKCGAPIAAYEVNTDFADTHSWQRTVSVRVEGHTISFEPCRCEIHMPPDELEVQVGPRVTGWEELLGLIAEVGGLE